MLRNTHWWSEQTARQKPDTEKETRSRPCAGGGFCRAKGALCIAMGFHRCRGPHGPCRRCGRHRTCRGCRPHGPYGPHRSHRPCRSRWPRPDRGGRIQSPHHVQRGRPGALQWRPLSGGHQRPHGDPGYLQRLHLDHRHRDRTHRPCRRYCPVNICTTRKMP